MASLDLVEQLEWNEESEMSLAQESEGFYH